MSVKTFSIMDLEHHPGYGKVLPTPSPAMVRQAELHGLTSIPAIEVRQRRRGGHEVVGGMRSWRVAVILGMKQLQVVVLDLSDEEAASRVEFDKLDPVRPNAMDQARYVERFCRDRSVVVANAAFMLGINHETAKGYMQLLQLDAMVQGMVEDGRLTFGKARVLCRLKKSEQLAMATRILREGLNTREVEELVPTRWTLKKAKTTAKHPVQDQQTQATSRGGEGGWAKRDEQALTERLGVSVEIAGSPHAGTVRLPYFSEENLEGVVEYFRAKDLRSLSQILHLPVTVEDAGGRGVVVITYQDMAGIERVYSGAEYDPNNPERLRAR